MIIKNVDGPVEAAEAASNSRAFVAVARTGFAVSGVLHVLVGAIAVQLAFGKAGEADQGGAMGELAARPAGYILLWLGAVSCVALVLWQASEAIFGYRHLQKKAMLRHRLSAAGQGLAFLFLALAFASFASGRSRDSGEATSDSSIQVMKAPFGPQLLIAVGVVVALVGVAFAVRGVRTSFTRQLKMPASAPARRFLTVLGVAGYVAKGTALFLVGLLFIVSTLQADPEEATGLDGALKAVRAQPYGPYVLTLLGAGLVCYGCFQITKAKFARM